MSGRNLVILHGWSDHASSFETLSRRVSEKLGEEVTRVDLGDWVSMDDAVSYEDLASAMDRAWTKAALPRRSRSVDAIVHSTGALVVREWLSSLAAAGKALPIHRLVMLAPANFGSPLAHKGRAMLGRLAKGMKMDKPFQTGEALLRGLEIASPYTFDLAMRDLFSERRYYGVGGILTTVLVGNTGYSGARRIANEDGGDGTVRVSTASLNAALLTVDYGADPLNPRVEMRWANALTALRVLQGRNHSTVALKEEDDAQADETLKRITEALSVDDASFEAHVADCAKATAALTEEYAASTESEHHGFQNTVVRMTDQYDRPVDDYFIEFTLHDEDSGWFEEKFQCDVVHDVHRYEPDHSYRSLYFDCAELDQRVDKPDEGILIKIAAEPELGEKHSVGFRRYDDAEGAIHIPRDAIGEYFVPNRTLLLRVRMHREQSHELFRFLRPTSEEPA